MGRRNKVLPLLEDIEITGVANEGKATYMANMLHPNRAGMDEIALEVVKVLKENYK